MDAYWSYYNRQFVTRRKVRFNYNMVKNDHSQTDHFFTTNVKLSLFSFNADLIYLYPLNIPKKYSKWRPMAWKVNSDAVPVRSLVSKSKGSKLVIIPIGEVGTPKYKIILRWDQELGESKYLLFACNRKCYVILCDFLDVYMNLWVIWYGDSIRIAVHIYLIILEKGALFVLWDHRSDRRTHSLKIYHNHEWVANLTVVGFLW